MIYIFTGPVINFTFGSNGTYLLYLRIDKPITVRIQREELTIDEGNYLYVGSAFGAGGLTSRIHRHLRRKKKNHWHIDQITSIDTCQIHGVAVSLNRKKECEIANLLVQLENVTPIPNFGNSDCRNNCISHFFHVQM